jgi:flagellar protein FliS
MSGMTQAGRAAQHYLQTQVRSSSPLELVVMLYDGALRSSAAACEAMARRDIPARRAAISKTMAIIGELQNTLDMQGGGEIAERLDQLYTWMTAELVQATVRQDPAPIHEVRRILETLREGWHQIAARAPGSAA